VEVDLVAALEVEVVVALEDLVEEAAAAAVPAEAGSTKHFFVEFQAKRLLNFTL
jgi:hypothetical protein